MTVNMAAAVTPVFPYRMLHLLNFKVQQQQLQKNYWSCWRYLLVDEKSVKDNEDVGGSSLGYGDVYYLASIIL